MSESPASRIFIGSKTLGYVSNHVPLVTRYIHRRKEHLIVTVVGRVFHTYGGAKLGLLSRSQIHPEDITAVTADAFLVFTAAGKDIYAWRRGSELKHVYKGHESAVRLMIPFGPQLISVDEKSVLKVWDIKKETLVAELEFAEHSFAITSLVHPATYINKIVLGSKQGTLQLWNINTCEKIYRFKGWRSAVLCLEQAPAVDVLAIGLENGEIYIHNLKFDETIMKFSQDWGPVSCLSFRTDGQPILISTGSNHVAMWDLEARKLSSQIQMAHDDDITGAQCLPGEPLMVSSSPDNTLKQWIFDMPDGGGRLLRIKEGHAKPPNKIRFYGGLGHNILSAGEDSSLRSFSTVTDLLNKSFGVASYNRKISKKLKKFENSLKMRPITDFTTEVTRDRDWDNIACVHRDTTMVTTWSFGYQKMGNLKLQHERFKKDKSLRDVKATCVNLSVCGNFVIIGYTSGHIDKYNIQSGIYRGSYSAKDHEEAHPSTAIRAICSDGLNQLLISGDAEGCIKFWRFSKKMFMCKMQMTSEIVRMDLHRDSGLLAVVLVNFALVVIDIVSKKIVRKFEGHKRQITDLAISADSRWLVTCSVDRSCKVWDIPTGQLVDHFLFSKPVTSMSMSPRGQYLATSHADDLGIYLWSNLSLYSHVSLKALPANHQPKEIKLPMETTTGVTAEEAHVEEMDVDELEFSSPQQIAENLITLANLPSSRWQNLLSLDTIKARNKPTDAVKKPSNAPFFLPTVSGLETKFDLAKTEGEGATADGTRIIVSKPLELTPFAKELLVSEDAKHFLQAMTMLKEKGPAAIEVELLSLSPEGGGSKELMHQFLVMIRTVLEAKVDFEAAQGYLALFLKLHSDNIIESSDLSQEMERILKVQETVAAEINDSLTNSATLVAFFKNSVIC